MSDDVRNNQRRVSFYNDSGETIPPYGVLNLVSDAGAPSDIFDFCRRIKARKFTDAEDNGKYALNGRAPVLAGKYGECMFAMDAPAFAAISQVDLGDDPNLSADDAWFGQEWGPVEGKWTLSPDGQGFTLLARPNLEYVSGYSRVLVLAKPFSDDEAWFVVETSHFVGNGPVPGVQFLGHAGKIKKWHGWDDGLSQYSIYPEEWDTEYRSYLYGKFYDKLIGPGEVVRAKRFVVSGTRNDGSEFAGTPETLWIPLQGGSTFYPFAKTYETINPTGLVDIYVPADPLNVKNDITGSRAVPGEPFVDSEYAVWPPNSDWTFIRVECLWPVTQTSIPSGTWVTCEWQPVARRMVITGLACPNYSSD